MFFIFVVDFYYYCGAGGGKRDDGWAQKGSRGGISAAGLAKLILSVITSL
jgi:hypothetical protein